IATLDALTVDLNRPLADLSINGWRAIDLCDIDYDDRGRGGCVDPADGEYSRVNTDFDQVGVDPPDTAIEGLDFVPEQIIGAPDQHEFGVVFQQGQRRGKTSAGAAAQVDTVFADDTCVAHRRG